MGKPAQKKLILLFWILAVLDLVGIAAGIDAMHFVFKPLLVPALLLLLTQSKTTQPRKFLLVAGLFFAWLGDVFLLFEFKHSLFFIAGLACFLTTHIFYISYFLKISSTKTSMLARQPLWVAVVIAYGAILVWQLFPELGDLTIPVIIYATIICIMLLCSIHVFNKVNRQAALYFLSGATVFVVSDSLLAINKFYQPFAFAGVLIMLTYCAAQYLIVRGFIEQDKS